jgi:CDP-diacylglycerol--glycerol-3-phosphate 3-phosphatidyltransferase
MGEETTRNKRRVVAERVNYFLLRIANLLTLARLLATPLVVYLIWLTAESTDYDLATVGLIVALQATDVLDGYIARQAKADLSDRRARVNPIGELLDPIADKLYINSAVITLMIIGRVPLWAGGLIVARDAFIAVGWLARYVLTGVRLLPNLLGKLADSAQAILVIAVLLRLADPILTVWLWTVAALTVASGLAYAKRALTASQQVRG